MSKKYLKDKAWQAFARYIKARYSDKYGMCLCVTCGARHHYQDGHHINAGHFVAGRGNSVLFDEDLVRPQCVTCNCAGSGEQYRFAQYLVGSEGKTQEQIEELLSRRHKVVKFTDQDLRDIAEKYNNMADAIIQIKKI